MEITFQPRRSGKVLYESLRKEALLDAGFRVLEFTPAGRRLWKRKGRFTIIEKLKDQISGWDCEII